MPCYGDAWPDGRRFLLRMRSELSGIECYTLTLVRAVAEARHVLHSPSASIVALLMAKPLSPAARARTAET